MCAQLQTILEIRSLYFVVVVVVVCGITTKEDDTIRVVLTFSFVCPNYSLSFPVPPVPHTDGADRRAAKETESPRLVRKQPGHGGGVAQPQTVVR